MHSLIVGVTECGKTSLATSFSKGLLSQGKKVVVYDPIGGTDWGTGAKVYDDINKLMEFVQSNESYHIFIDESGEALDEGYSREHNWLATRSRHWGHSVYFIGQRALQIPKTMRCQCTRLYIFTTAIDDCKTLAGDFNAPGILVANTLPQYHFFVVDRYGMFKKFRLVKKNGSISVKVNKDGS